MMFDRRRDIIIRLTNNSIKTISPENHWNYDSVGIYWEDDHVRHIVPWTSIISAMQEKDSSVKNVIRNYELE